MGRIRDSIRVLTGRARVAPAPAEPAPEPALPRVPSTPRGEQHGYYGTPTGPNVRWAPGRIHPDSDLATHNYWLRSRSVDVANRTALGAGYFERLCDDVVGEGVTPKPMPRYKNGKLIKGFAAEAETLWQMMSTTLIDRARVRTLAMYQDVVLRTWAEKGSVVIHAPFIESPDAPVPLQIYGIDPDWLDDHWLTQTGAGDNEIRNGIEIERATGRIVAFHVTQPRGLDEAGESKRILAEQCFYCFRPERLGQYLGGPWLSPVLENMHDVAGYKRAERIRARDAAGKSHYIKTDNPAATAAGWQGTTQTATDQDGNTYSYRTEELPVGVRVYLRPGEEVINPDGNIPLGQYKEFVTGEIREIAVGAGTSYENLVGDFSNTHFSAARAVHARDARRIFRLRNVFLVPMFCQPLYERMLDAAVLSGWFSSVSMAQWFGDAEYRWRMTRARWKGGGLGWHNPLEDAKASEFQLANGLASREELCAARGKSLDDVLDELEAEEADIQSRGLVGVTRPGHRQLRLFDEPEPKAKRKPGSKESEPKPSGKNGTAKNRFALQE